MFYYRPPKSSIWGHSLRKMPPAKERSLFQEFLTRAVAEYKLEIGTLSYLGLDRLGRIRHFEQLLGVPSLNGGYYSLTPEQFDRCFASILADDTLLPGLMLTQSITVSQWSIAGQPVPTESRFHLYYGIKPCVSTTLRFDTIEQYNYIKQVLSDLKFCTLNELHLKPVKTRAAKTKA